MTRSFCLFLVFTLGVLSPTELLAQLGGTIAPGNGNQAPQAHAYPDTYPGSIYTLNDPNAGGSASIDRSDRDAFPLIVYTNLSDFLFSIDSESTSFATYFPLGVEVACYDEEIGEWHRYSAIPSIGDFVFPTAYLMNTFALANPNAAFMFRVYPYDFIGPIQPGDTYEPPTTLTQIGIRDRIMLAGHTPAEEGEFFGWGGGVPTRDPDDFTREELEDRGWTESYLNWLAQGYEEVSVLTPSNPSAGPRAHQIREIVRLHFSEN